MADVFITAPMPIGMEFITPRTILFVIRRTIPGGRDCVRTVVDGTATISSTGNYCTIQGWEEERRLATGRQAELERIEREKSAFEEKQKAKIRSVFQLTNSYRYIIVFL